MAKRVTDVKVGPGIAFERVVAALQARFDPATTVNHNVVLLDRIGQKRQFDVVIRGMFAGQPLLGVIECKDLSRPIGTPEVDAFHTKSSDANANFRILMSRRGFSQPAIDKCKHYGIQTLSLMEKDATNQKFKIGNYLQAEFWSYEQIKLALVGDPYSALPLNFDLNLVKLNSQPVLGWYANYLAANGRKFTHEGWTAEVHVAFDRPQMLDVAGVDYLCAGLQFSAERKVARLEYFVGINGDGFYDWQNNQIRFPANSEIISDAVPMDMSKWQPKQVRPPGVNNWINATILGGHPVARFENAIDLEKFGSVIEIDGVINADVKPTSLS